MIRTSVGGEMRDGDMTRIVFVDELMERNRGVESFRN